jgi:hypothetical protein
MEQSGKYKNVEQAGRPGKTQARCLCYCQDGRVARGKTQARCLCYCKDGRDARGKHRRMPQSWWRSVRALIIV